jgi:protein-S-isoprenylcysteine O-methyltransferase Ste14
MNWRTWLERALLALAILMVAAINFGALGVLARNGVSPASICYEAFNAWSLTWLIAAIWAKPAVARPPLAQDAMHWTPTVIGFVFLAYGSAIHYPPPFRWINAAQLWVMPDALGWAVAAVCIGGFAFTWWARISLGSLWSGSVSRKNEHQVVRSGPYAIVRHPIYTGLIVAMFAIGSELGMAINIFGAALMAFGFWLKARLEERFLAQQLGADAYRDYRRSTPMLAPFWPTH